MSEERLRTAAWLAVGAMTLFAIGFHTAQNAGAAVGGEIAWSKAAWLALAILLWILLPAVILFDPRVPRAAKAPFAWLCALMLARGVAELFMLYMFHNWSPWYGIAHDLVCMAAVWGLGARARAAGAYRAGPAARALGVHTVVTGWTLAPEIYYAWYMQAHFQTRGGNAIYFVPDDGQHVVALAVTAAVDIALIAYLAAFLPAWLPRRAPTRAES